MFSYIAIRNIKISIINPKFSTADIYTYRHTLNTPAQLGTLYCVHCYSKEKIPAYERNKFITICKLKPLNIPRCVLIIWLSCQITCSISWEHHLMTRYSKSHFQRFHLQLAKKLNRSLTCINIETGSLSWHWSAQRNSSEEAACWHRLSIKYCNLNFHEQRKLGKWRLIKYKKVHLLIGSSWTETAEHFSESKKKHYAAKLIIPTQTCQQIQFC